MNWGILKLTKKTEIQKPIAQSGFRVGLKFAAEIEKLLRVFLARDAVINQRLSGWNALFRIIA